MDKPTKCPACGSRQPQLHPAMQSGGEVELCTHDFHLAPSPSNPPAYIAAVMAKRSIQAKRLTNG